MSRPAPLLKLQSDMPGEPSSDRPGVERSIAGRPRRDTWNVADARCGAAVMSCGVWHSEPGHWRFAFGPDEHELFTVLQGRCRVHASDGSFQEVGPGEALLIPGGFVGSFEVLEPLKKTYAILAHGD